MARTRVVTRTIEDTVVECKVLRTIKNEDYIITEEYHLGAMVDPKKYITLAQKQAKDSDTVVKVINVRKESQIYGMLETDFIKLAKKMNEERKFIMDDGTEVSADDAE